MLAVVGLLALGMLAHIAWDAATPEPVISPIVVIAPGDDDGATLQLAPLPARPVARPARRVTKKARVAGRAAVAAPATPAAAAVASVAPVAVAPAAPAPVAEVPEAAAVEEPAPVFAFNEYPVPASLPPVVAAEPERAPIAEVEQTLTFDGNGESIAQAIAHAKRGAVQKCFERELKKSPALKGSVAVELDLAPPMQVNAVRVTDDLGRPEFTSCVSAAMQRLSFMGLNEEVSIHVPYVLAARTK